MRGKAEDEVTDSVASTQAGDLTAMLRRETSRLSELIDVCYCFPVLHTIVFLHRVQQ